MLLEERLEMTFERAHVQDPLICSMAKQYPDVLFNIHQLSVGPHEARMLLSLIGEIPELRSIREYFESLGVNLRVVDTLKFKGKIPQVPRRVSMSTGGKTVERKLWLTIVGTLRSQHFLWTLTRRFDVTYKIAQSVTSDPVSIVSLLIWGPPAEVDGAVEFLREQGVNVETGVVGVSAPFGPVS